MPFKLMIALELQGITGLLVSIRFLLNGKAEKRLLIVSLCGSIVQNAGYLLELMANSADNALLAVKVEYLGSMFVPLFYCMFICGYCNHFTPRAVKMLFTLLGVIDLGMLAIIFTCDRHSLFYQDVSWLESAYGQHYLSLTYGVLYILCLICQTVIPFALSLFWLSRAILRHKGSEPGKRYAVFLAISLIPVLALLAYALKLTNVFDPTPVALAFCLSMVGTMA